MTFILKCIGNIATILHSHIFILTQPVLQLNLYDEELGIYLFLILLKNKKGDNCIP